MQSQQVLRRPKHLIIRDFLLYLKQNAKSDSDCLTEEQKAYILAYLGYRPKMDAINRNRNNVLIVATKSPKRLEKRAFVANHILDIVRINRAGITKLELIKECERTLTTSQNILGAINNSINKLKNKGLVRVIKDKSSLQVA